MKKILALVLALTTVFALAIPAMAADTHVFEDCNATFHCGGRVWPVIPSAYQVTDSKGKTTTSFPVTRVGTSTAWALDDSQGKIVCPACGRSDWVTFSNNSGVPNGSNPQFDHDPNKKQITIKVIYKLEIPRCTKTCKYANLPDCVYNCDCPDPCPYLAHFKSHVCALDCKKDAHDSICGIKNFTPCNPSENCTCEKNVEKTVYKKTLLIPISGYNFKFTAHKTWSGGVIVAGTNRVIDELLTADATYYFNYKGCGKCKCTCTKPECGVECVPCAFKPICDHDGIICDNCKNGKGNNHSNCEFGNPNTTSNYFCLKCAKKVGALKWDKKTNLYSWEPADKGENAWSPANPAPYLPICECGCPKP